MIAIIDYQMGNLKSVAKALESVGGEVCVTREKQKIKDAAKIVLPGVGAFGQCMKNLIQYDLVDVVKDQIKTGKPFLGICLGLQLLFEDSEESPDTKGLGVLKGKVVQFDAARVGRVPHMGWNQISSQQNVDFLKGVDANALFYFVHSYYVVPDDKAIVATTTDYGEEFCSAVSTQNIWATQFHPEKSQKLGLKLLENFVRL